MYKKEFYRGMAKDHAETIDSICDILGNAKCSPQTGEHLLLWIAGLSMGKRQCPIANDSVALEVFATGWQVGASDTTD